MISATELATMQHDVQGAMPDTATVLRAPAATSAGGWDQNLQPHHTSRCRLTGLTGPIEETAAAEIAAVSRWRMVVPAGTDVMPSDRVQCNGHTFEVAGKIDADSFNITDTWYLEEVRR